MKKMNEQTQRMLNGGFTVQSIYVTGAFNSVAAVQTASRRTTKIQLVNVHGLGNQVLAIQY